MTDLSDKVLEELLAKATPGRWRDKPSVHGSQYRFVQIGKDKNYTTLEMKPDDARLAALAPSLARALMEARKESDELVASMQSSQRVRLRYLDTIAALQSKLDQIGVRCRIWAEGKVSPDTALTDIAAILQDPKP